MSTWNQPLWGDQNQPGMIDDQPLFPELYIRNFLNDLGQLPNELTPLKWVEDQLICTVQGQTQFTLTLLPSMLYSPIVYVNGTVKYPTIDYIVNSRIITFPNSGLNLNDLVTVKYAN